MVSIIIPVYNTSKYLRECVDSVLNQTYSDIEILLLDDGSTDGSADICDEYVKKDGRVKCFHVENGGVSKARNIGLKNAQGDYICFLDSDDYYAKQYVSSMLEMIENQNADVVICNHYDVNEQGEIMFASDIAEGYISKELLYQKIFITSEIGGFSFNKIYKADLIKNIYFNETIHICEDTYFCCQVYEKARQIYVTSEKLYFYRKHKNSATSIENGFERLLETDGTLKYISTYEKMIKDKILPQEYDSYIKIGMCVVALTYERILRKADRKKYKHIRAILSKTIRANIVLLMKCRKIKFSRRIKWFLYLYL